MRQPNPAAVWLILKTVGLFAAAGIAAAQNPIVLENQQPGTSQWQIPSASTGNDTTGQIKGYASASSINKGQAITFYVSVNPAQSYTIDVYRMGWYQGLGGRLIQHIGPLNGTNQPTCPTDSTTGKIECHWAAAWTLSTQISWTSGIYLALLTNAQGYTNYIIFVVRDDNRVAALLYQQPVMTYQAYNDYPYDSKTGKSLYAFNSYGANTVSGNASAVKVSFDRPYDGDGTGIAWGQSFLNYEYAFVRWIEKSGYDVTYATDIDTHITPSILLNYRGVLSVGHDEYWSKPMYDGAITALGARVNLGFFGADAIAWQVRMESSSSGAPYRVLVCYRSATLDPITDSTLKTVMWRDSPLNRPEQTLIGVMYAGEVAYNNGSYAPYVVTNSGNWVYAGTGLTNGNSVPGIIGYEADALFSAYPTPNAVSGTYTLLSSSPFSSTQTANSSVYQASSGAWVFGAGTLRWTYALDNYNGANLINPGIQQTTANVLNRFANPTVDFSIAASPSSQTVAPGGPASYGVTISQTGGFSGQVTLGVSGVPSGASGSFSPNPATASSALSVTTTASTPAGTYTLTITGVSGALTHTTTVALIVSSPANNDFKLSASSSQAVTQGGATSYSVTISPTGGFNRKVTLSVSGLPSGANGSFSPNPATASSTLSVTTSTSTPPGTYSLVITGDSGNLTHTTTASLIVSAPTDFTLSASLTSQTVTQGGSASYGVTISPAGGFTGQVTLSATGLPGGASSSFSPNPASTSSTMSVTTSASTPPGTYTLTITGVSGSLTHATTVVLVVSAPADFTLSALPSSQTVTQGGAASYSVTIGPTGGFSGQVTLSATGLPSGANGSFSPNPATASSTLSVTTSASTPTGTYTLTITGVSGSLTHTATVTLVVNAAVLADFTLSASPSSQTVTQGGSTSYSVTINPAGGFTGQVTLSVSGLPTGANGSFNPNPAAASSTLSVTTSASTPTGTYTLTITGVSGSLTHTATVTLLVNAAVLADFTLSASPSIQTVTQGGSTSYSVTINPTGGFTGQVTFSVTGLPNGANGSLSPNPATTSSTLSVTTGASTPTGSYTLTITGVSGALTHTATVTLVVNAAALADFTLSASLSSQTVLQGGSTSYSVTINPTGGFTGQVTLSVSGLPTGANGTFNPNPATASSSLSVATSASTPSGGYTLTITGVSGALTHTTTVSLTVAGAGVTYDNGVSSGVQFGVTKVTTPAFVIGNGANRAAMIMVTMSANGATNITATLGGVTGTLIPGTDSGATAAIRTLLFQVINPPSGSQTATVSWTTSMNVDVGVMTVSGADQTTPCTSGTFAANNSSPDQTTSLTIASNAGDLTASVGYTTDVWVTPFTNESLKWGIDSGVTGGDIGAGTGTTTHTWKDQYFGQTHAASGANFKASTVP